MAQFTRDHLIAYLDDALSDSETAQIEKHLRDSESLRQKLRDILSERDRGEHSLGAIWRRERLTCPNREQLGSFLLEVLEPEHQVYLDFHLNTVGCPFCQANLADLREHVETATADSKKRRQRYYQSSAGLLKQ